MDSNDEESHFLKFKTKRKKKNLLPMSESLELKHRTRRQGKCVGAALEVFNAPDKSLCTEQAEKSCEYVYIINDIWYHLAKYIAPEDVQNYALICSQSAYSINSRGFWWRLYRQHCQPSLVEELPNDLKILQIKNITRQSAIMALFHCYEPFKKRLKVNYKLETLQGRTYIASWHTQVQCVWQLCYKFKHNFPLNKKTSTENETSSREDEGERVVNDWESLADDESSYSGSLKPPFCTNDLNGISLLIIYSKRFIPFSSEIDYNQATSRFQLAASRELLSTDMRSINLELDFVSFTRIQTITVRYSEVQKYRVIPWWHPEFKDFCGGE